MFQNLLIMLICQCAATIPHTPYSPPAPLAGAGGIGERKYNR